MYRRKLSFLNRIRFVLGLPMHNVFNSELSDAELHNLISKSVEEMNKNFSKIKEEEVRKLVLYTAALQVRIAKFNMMEAGYPEIPINSIYKEQP